jgi:hypothetical protein
MFSRLGYVVPRRALYQGGGSMRKLLLLGVVFGCMGACGGGGGGESTPAPSPTPTPTPTTFTLRGQVSETAPFTANKIAGAKVEFVDGANAGKSATTDNDGNYTISNASRGGFTLRATADGFHSTSVGVTLTSDVTQNFQLQRAGPRTQFGSGQYRVNTDIAPGRYYSVPSDGCYWERQKGLGGTTSDIIANEFIGFDAGQWIVELKASDLAFQTDPECGIWYNTPRTGSLGSTIRPGMWLVGSQVSPGRYAAATSDGCYWERLRDFSGTSNGIIANDFVSGGGSRLVEVRRADLGFSTDDDCGDWNRTSSLSPLEEGRQQTLSDIENNRRLRDQRSPRLIVR